MPVHAKVTFYVCELVHTHPYLELALDVLEHCHWIWIRHSVGDYCRAKDFS